MQHCAIDQRTQEMDLAKSMLDPVIFEDFWCFSRDGIQRPKRDEHPKKTIGDSAPFREWGGMECGGGVQWYEGTKHPEKNGDRAPFSEWMCHGVEGRKIPRTNGR